MKWYLALFTGRGICFFELGEQDEEGMSGMGGGRRGEKKEGVREDSISELFFIFGRKRRKIRE
ncbi:hypothetical protein [Scardovia wiggsiae]|uniref:hypothetical protein n=1 Tax=Scardovia wiggsiae TaxID=230143 RepID=UPI0012DD57DE|nr:hypothetical protein [Scardovia wiggsiae]